MLKLGGGGSAALLVIVDLHRCMRNDMPQVVALMISRGFDNLESTYSGDDWGCCNLNGDPLIR